MIERKKGNMNILSIKVDSKNNLLLNNLLQLNNVIADVYVIKDYYNEIKLYLNKENLILHIEYNNKNFDELICNKKEYKADLNLTNNNYFSFNTKILINSDEVSSPFLIKAIYNQFYLLKNYNYNLYNENNNNEFLKWNKYLKIQEDIIDNKDFYFIVENIIYNSNEAIINIASLNEDLKNKIRKNLFFKAYIIDSVDINLSLHLWDEDYVNMHAYFGRVKEIKNGSMVIELDDRLINKEKSYILRASFFGEDIQLSRLKFGMKNISSHFFSGYMFGDKKIQHIPLLELNNLKNKINYFNMNLNETQKLAVLKAILTKELLLIQGPPGTGKTEVITEIALQEININKKVLITSQMNLAVTEPLNRIKNHDNSIKIMKIDNSDYSYNDKDAQIYGATLNKCGSKEFKELIFDTVIIDEVSKATPPELILPILLSKKIILIGDHKQLPPTIKNYEIDLLIDELNLTSNNDINFEESIFEVLLKKNDHGKVMLDEQYRMHPNISKVISFFYDNKLKNAEITHTNREHNIPNLKHLNWINHNEFEKKYNDGVVNNREIEIIEEYLEIINSTKIIYENEKKPEVGIITFYKKQAEMIKNKIIINKYSNIKLDINVLDRFQGQTRDIIICSMVRNNNNNDIGFLKFPNRINVAFSRSKRMLIVIGSKKFFQESVSEWKSIIDYF